MSNADITGTLSRLRRDFPRWHFTHHATAASPEGTFLARRPVPLNDSPDVLATAASEEQELRRRVNIQEAIAQRLLAYDRNRLTPDRSGGIAVVVADLEQSHPRWRIVYEIRSAGAAFVARRAAPARHTHLGLTETVDATTARELSWRLACQDAQIAAVSMAEGPGNAPAPRLSETVAGFENLLRRAAGEL